MINGEMPASPCVIETTEYDGLTKREAFAMAAMQGLALVDQRKWSEIAKSAVEAADALLEALEETK